MKHAKVTHGYLVRETNHRRQVVEILRRFDLFGAIAPFGRCLECNGVLERSGEGGGGTPPAAPDTAGLQRLLDVPGLQSDLLAGFDATTASPPWWRTFAAPARRQVAPSTSPVRADDGTRAALGMAGGVPCVVEFTTTPAGHRQPRRVVLELRHLDTRSGVEGTGSFGAGLSRYLRSSGVDVVEVADSSPPPSNPWAVRARVHWATSVRSERSGAGQQPLRHLPLRPSPNRRV